MTEAEYDLLRWTAHQDWQRTWLIAETLDLSAASWPSGRNPDERRAIRRRAYRMLREFEGLHGYVESRMAGSSRAWRVLDAGRQALAEYEQRKGRGHDA